MESLSRNEARSFWNLTDLGDLGMSEEADGFCLGEGVAVDAKAIVRVYVAGELVNPHVARYGILETSNRIS